MKYLVLDDGYFAEHASALAEKGKNTVFYHTQWEKASASIHDNAPGVGFDYLTKIDAISPHVKEADCIVSFDVYFNDDLSLIKSLLPNKSYFGAGLLGEELENDRWGLKKIVKQLGLPLQKSVRIKGIDKLREYLQKNKDVYVKIDRYKKDFESFHAKDYKTIEGTLDYLQGELGAPFKNEIKFVVEETIKSDVEVGADLIFNRSEFLKPYLYGYELKKIGYIGRFSNELPAPLKETLDKFIPILKKMDYSGMISTEEKIVDLKKHYLLDVCSRGALPLTLGYGEWIKNFPEMVYKVGKREAVKLDAPYKYVAAFPLASSENKEEYIRIEIKPEGRKNVKMWCPTKLGNDYFSVKGSEFAAVLIGWGNTVDEAIKMVEKSADYVDGYCLNKDLSSLHKIKELIEKGKKVGIPF